MRYTPVEDICSCCNLSGDVALNVWFTTNGMCVKNNTIHICGSNKQQQSDHGMSLFSIVACCHSAKLCAYATRDSRSQHSYKTAHNIAEHG